MLFACTPMSENCHEAGSALHVACACCDQRAGRADDAGFKRLCRQARGACGPRSALLRGRWRPLLELRHEARSSSTQPRQSASSSSTCAARLPQRMDLPVIVIGRRRPRRIHRLLSSSASCRAILSRRRALGLRDLFRPKLVARRMTMAESRGTCRRSSPSGVRD